MFGEGGEGLQIKQPLEAPGFSKAGLSVLQRRLARPGHCHLQAGASEDTGSSVAMPSIVGDSPCAQSGL